MWKSCFIQLIQWENLRRAQAANKAAHGTAGKGAEKERLWQAGVAGSSRKRPRVASENCAIHLTQKTPPDYAN